MWIPVNFSYLWTPIRCTASLRAFFQSCTSSLRSFSKSSAICVDVCKNNIRWEGTRPPALSQGTLGLSLILSGQDHLQEAPGHPATRQANETPSNPPHHPGPPTHPGPHPPIHPTPSISTWVTRLSDSGRLITKLIFDVWTFLKVSPKTWSTQRRRRVEPMEPDGAEAWNRCTGVWNRWSRYNLKNIHSSFSLNSTGSTGSTRLCIGSMPRLHAVPSVPHACAELSEGGETSKAMARAACFWAAETALLKPRRASKTKAPAGSRVE